VKKASLGFFISLLLLPLNFSFAQPLETGRSPALSVLKSAFCPFSSSNTKKLLDHEFLEHGGLSDIKSGLASNSAQFGKCLDIKEKEKNAYELVYQRASVPLDLVFDERAKIKVVFFGMPRISDDSFEKVVQFLKDEKHNTSYLLQLENGKKISSHNDTQPLNISRSNLIFILDAAKRGIKENQLRKEDVVALKKKRAIKTFSVIQSWSDGTLISVDSLLNLMTTDRDVSAADLLIERIGRENIERLSNHLKPFLTFREYYLLLELEKKDLNTKQKIQAMIAAKKDLPPPESYQLDRYDLVPHVGWFATSQDICSSAFAAKEEILAMNERLANEYASVQSKEIEKFGLIQTRDSGVSQVTALIKTKNAPWLCLAITSNSELGEIEESFFSTLYSRLLNLSLLPVAR
jgi:hypothetical protein